MKNNIFTNGDHVLSGIKRDVAVTRYDKWNHVEGVIVEVDHQRYFMFEDPDDGYRSYSNLFPINENTLKEFEIDKEYHDILLNEQLIQIPNEKVNIELQSYNKDEFDTGTTKYVFTNPHTKQVILEIGTENENDWYPCAIFHWYPENLDCNRNNSII